MKNLVTLFVLLTCTTFWAQQEIVINKNIQALKLNSAVQIELFVGANENKLIGDEEVLEAINYKVSDYELKIGLPIGKIIDGDFPLKLKVYTKNIDRLNAVQGSIVEIQNTVKSSNFSIRATEGSVISGDFDTETLELKALSGAIIDISGKSETLDVLANTGGQYLGEQLKAKDTKVKVTYGGTAQVYTTQNCEASVVAGGTIDVFGKPKYVNEKTTFGGNINIIKD